MGVKPFKQTFKEIVYYTTKIIIVAIIIINIILITIFNLINKK